MLQFVICAALVAFVVREWQHHKERTDLLNRLMARDYGEYTYSKVEHAPKPQRNFVLESIQKAHNSRLSEFDED